MFYTQNPDFRQVSDSSDGKNICIKCIANQPFCYVLYKNL